MWINSELNKAFRWTKGRCSWDSNRSPRVLLGRLLLSMGTGGSTIAGVLSEGFLLECVCAVIGWSAVAPTERPKNDLSAMPTMAKNTCYRIGGETGQHCDQ
mmetsp:Transcript_16254/g.37435  ORF Transcript_16254/g.37435 Transcript_16254/m.37435 type:complete len:101 (-) Transcript_16254:57-359(-)